MLTALSNVSCDAGPFRAMRKPMVCPCWKVFHAKVEPPPLSIVIKLLFVVAQLSGTFQSYSTVVSVRVPPSATCVSANEKRITCPLVVAFAVGEMRTLNLQGLVTSISSGTRIGG